MYERARQRGYKSLTAFAEARPTASLAELAEELGRDDVAGTVAWIPYATSWTGALTRYGAEE